MPPEVSLVAGLSTPQSCSQCHQPIQIVHDHEAPEENIEDAFDQGNTNILLSPLCEVCMNEVLEDLKNDIASANNELAKYTEALFELERDRRGGRFTDDENENRKLLLTQKQAELAQELKELQQEETSLTDELRQLMNEEKLLDAEEVKLRDDLVNLMRTIVDSEESLESVNHKLQYCQSSLRKLKRMRLLSEAFHIHPGSGSSGFASINGLRLGRSPAIPWSEVNAALGFLCLLLDELTTQLNLSLSQYRLLPRGSSSVIIKKADKSVLELFSDEGSGGITRFLTGRKFDSAMIALVQIVDEMVSHLQGGDGSVRMPFRIEENEGKVGGLPVGLQFNSEENWTRAMKMLLTNVKAIVTIVEARNL